MIPPAPILEEYGISPRYGFLPMELPLEVLPDPYYSRWEAIAANLHALILSRRLRGVIKGLPVLSTSRLQHPAEWRRAYMLFAFMTHAYIWGGDRPEEVCNLARILCSSLICKLEGTAANLYSLPQDLHSSRATACRNICRRVPVELQTHLQR